VTKILYHRLLLLEQFRFCETYFTTYQRFVADQSANTPSLGGGCEDAWTIINTPLTQKRHRILTQKRQETLYMNKTPQTKRGGFKAAWRMRMVAEEKRKKTKRFFGTQSKARAGWPTRLRLIWATAWADFAIITAQLWSTMTAISSWVNNSAFNCYYDLVPGITAKYSKRQIPFYPMQVSLCFHSLRCSEILVSVRIYTKIRTWTFHRTEDIFSVSGHITGISMAISANLSDSGRYVWFDARWSLPTTVVDLTMWKMFMKVGLGICEFCAISRRLISRIRFPHPISVADAICGSRFDLRDSKRRALENWFCVRICYMFLISECRGDWDLGLCTTSVLALGEPERNGKIRFFLCRNTFFSDFAIAHLFSKRKYRSCAQN